MAQRKQLLSVDYYYDSDTGMYEIGEIDFGISGEVDSYIKKYGRKGIKDILLTLTHLIWHIKERGYKIVEEKEKNSISQSCKSL